MHDIAFPAMEQILMKIDRALVLSAVLLAFAGAAPSAIAQKKPVKKPVVKKPAKNETKGQGQLTGGFVKFGEIYSLKSGINFQIISARYTMEPIQCYNKTYARADEKLVVVQFAVKNASKNEVALGDQENIITLFDDTGAKYEVGAGCIGLMSNGSKELYRTLKSGQGIGQKELNDNLQVCYRVPLSAKILKFMINEPRLNKNEEVLRYMMAGTDKDADPANVIAPLQTEIADPADKTGAVALKVGNGKAGTFYSAGAFQYRLDKIETTDKALIEGKDPEEGKKFVVATVTVKSLYGGSNSLYEAQCASSEIADMDGDKSKLLYILKPSSGKEIETSQEILYGETYTFRLVFEIDAKAKPKTLKISNDTYPWSFDISN